MSAIYTLGIDVGSTASKCIMLKDGQEIVAKSLIDVGAGTSGPPARDRRSAGKRRHEKRGCGFYPGNRIRS